MSSFGGRRVSLHSLFSGRKRSFHDTSPGTSQPSRLVAPPSSPSGQSKFNSKIPISKRYKSGVSPSKSTELTQSEIPSKRHKPDDTTNSLDVLVYSNLSTPYRAAIRKAHLAAGGVILEDLGPEENGVESISPSRRIYVLPETVADPNVGAENNPNVAAPNGGGVENNSIVAASLAAPNVGASDSTIEGTASVKTESVEGSPLHSTVSMPLPPVPKKQKSSHNLHFASSQVQTTPVTRPSTSRPTISVRVSRPQPRSHQINVSGNVAHHHNLNGRVVHHHHNIHRRRYRVARRLGFPSHHHHPRGNGNGFPSWRDSPNLYRSPPIPLRRHIQQRLREKALFLLYLSNINNLW